MQAKEGPRGRLPAGTEPPGERSIVVRVGRGPLPAPGQGAGVLQAPTSGVQPVPSPAGSWEEPCLTLAWSGLGPPRSHLPLCRHRPPQAPAPRTEDVPLAVVSMQSWTRVHNPQGARARRSWEKGVPCGAGRRMMG